MRQQLKRVGPHQVLYRDSKTGIAWVEDGSTGLGHSAHPNISGSGSVAGMKLLGYWDTSDNTVRSHGFIYNISKRIISDSLDSMAAIACECAGCLSLRVSRRPKQ